MTAGPGPSGAQPTADNTGRNSTNNPSPIDPHIAVRLEGFTSKHTVLAPEAETIAMNGSNSRRNPSPTPISKNRQSQTRPTPGSSCYKFKRKPSPASLRRPLLKLLFLALLCYLLLESDVSISLFNLQTKQVHSQQLNRGLIINFLKSLATLGLSRSRLFVAADGDGEDEDCGQPHINTETIDQSCTDIGSRTEIKEALGHVLGPTYLGVGSKAVCQPQNSVTHAIMIRRFGGTAESDPSP